MKYAACLLGAFVCSGALAAEPPQRTLTFEDRVKAQAAIERVYYSHQIGATKPFEQAVPRAVLEGKVHKYLDETAALKVYWKTAVTDEMLQRELERMAAGTRMPERLLELYAALGSDPFLIKECLVRATLVERMTRDRYSLDPNRVNARTSWDSWWATPSVSLRDGSTATVASDRGSLPISTENPSVGTGVDRRGTSDPTCAADDTWNGNSDDGQDFRVGHTAVWTGSVMVVWGGSNGSFRTNTGGRYDPATDSWTPTSTTGAPSARDLHTAVWTGSSMVVWGGVDPDYVNTGGRYDPATDSWTPTSATGAPSGRYGHTAVWTGSVMVVWGGSNGSFRTNTGGRYDPVTDSWTPTSTDGAPSARRGHTAVWIGSLMVAWGGEDGTTRVNTGGRYDPATDTWTPTSTTGAPSARWNPTAVWTGTLMVVWGGSDGYVQLNTGGRYDPATDSWTPTSTTGAPSGRYGHTAVWTGSLMVVWGGHNGFSVLRTGGLYSLGQLTSTWYRDLDGDGYGDAADSVTIPGCDGPPPGYVPDSTDCDDTNATVHPGATDVCNGIDDDCDGTTDEGCPSACSPAPSGLISWWAGDGSGLDLVGSNHGLLENGATFAPGLVSWAFDLDGFDDFVRVPDNPSLTPGTLTVDAWIYPRALPSGDIMAIVNKGDYSYRLQIEGRPSFPAGITWALYCGTWVDVFSGIQPPLNAWTHVAGTYDGAVATVYVNGSFAASVAVSCLATSTQDLAVGENLDYPTRPNFNGLVDEVHLYGRALSDIEILAVYQAGSSGVCKCVDGDGDGYYAELRCGTPPDCNDADPNTHPGAVEVCDGFDNDCSSVVDDSPTCVRVCDASATIYPPRPVPGGENPSGQPALAWNGHEYGMAFVKGSNELAHISFVAVDHVANEIVSASAVATPRSSQPTIVWAGDAYGLAYVQNDTASEVLRFARLSQSGMPIGNAHIVANGTPSLGNPDLAWNGVGYGIVWRAEHGLLSSVYFRSLSAAGEELTSIVALSDPTSSCGQPSIDWTGVDYGIVWGCHDGSQASNGLWFVRISITGLALSAPVRLSDCANFGVGQLASTEVGFGVTWISNDGRVVFTTIDPMGLALSPTVEIAAHYTDSLSMDWTGEEFVVSWHDRRLGDNLDHAYYRRLAADGSVASPEIRLTTGMREDTYPRLAWNGTDFGLVLVGSYPGGSCSGQCDLYFGRIGCGCQNADGDGFPQCRANLGGDCSDGDPRTYPGAPQVCDGRNNNCADPTWPTVPANEADNDGDGTPSCEDCDDFNSTIHPGAHEVCNTIDDNCNGQIDDDAQGLDSDGDGVHNACDNCRFAFNPDQFESDGDSIGNACDNCVTIPNPNQADADEDARGDVCDNCPLSANSFQDDFDGDRVGDVCDNCIFDWNATQTDFDQDNQGDLCDLNDGLIYVYSTDKDYREWQAETGYTTWNSYRGSLAVLRATGQYTQALGSNSLAAHDCGVSDAYVFDPLVPDPGEVAFNLVTGVSGGVESSLGTNSAGVPRANANPCP